MIPTIIIGVAIIALFAILTQLKTVRLVDQDEDYGAVGLGGMALSAADTFSVASIDDVIEPTIIYDFDFGDRKIGVKIEDILVWDVREWVIGQINALQITGLEDEVHELFAGIARDNTLDKTGYPTTQPSVGGEGAAVNGAASGVLNVMNQDMLPMIDTEFDFGPHTVVEEQSTVGQVIVEVPKLARHAYGGYSDGQSVQRHHLLTHANYYLWGNSTSYATAVASFRLAMDARLVSVDIEELFADRQVILNLADALTILTI